MPTTEYCTEYIGYNAECGEEATQKRYGFPLCDKHAAVSDHLDALAQRDDEFQRLLTLEEATC